MKLQNDNRKNPYKKKAECPEDVAEFIRIANLVPTDAEIPNYGQMAIPPPNEWEHLADFIRRELRDYPALIEYLGSGNFLKIQLRLQEFEKARLILKIIVGGSEHYRNKEGNKNQREYIVPFPGDGFVYLYANFPGGKYDESKKQGVINFRLSATLEDFNGLGLTRFRRCAICKSYFWAKKDNADSCGQACAKTLFNHNRAAKTAAAKEAREKWKNQDFSNKE